MDKALVKKIALRCLHIGESPWDVIWHSEDDFKTLGLELIAQAAKENPECRFGPPFPPGFDHAVESVSKELKSIYMMTFMDFDFYMDFVAKNIPEISESIISSGEDQGLLEIKTPIIPEKQWFEVGEKAIRICESLPGRGKSTLQLSDILVALASQKKIKIRPCCFLVKNKSDCAWYFERASWFGKEFSFAWVKSLQSEEKAEHTPNQQHAELFDGYYTQFLWTPRKDNEVHLSVEELPFKHSKLPDAETFPVRFVHAVISKIDGNITHIDGALHIYTKESYSKRLKMHLSDFYKDYSKAKIFRIDETLSFESCQPIIEAFFKWNRMVGEYFGKIPDQTTSEGS
jgi:hypothetical protein